MLRVLGSNSCYALPSAPPASILPRRLQCTGTVPFHMAVCRQWRQHEQQRHVFRPTERALAFAGAGPGAKGESDFGGGSVARFEPEQRQERPGDSSGKREADFFSREPWPWPFGLGFLKASSAGPRPGSAAQKALDPRSRRLRARMPSCSLLSRKGLPPFCQELRRARLRRGPRSAPAAALLAPPGGNGEREGERKPAQPPALSGLRAKRWSFLEAASRPRRELRSDPSLSLVPRAECCV